MKNFFILLRHELRMLLISSSTYIAAILFLLFMGFIYWAILRSIALVPQDLSPMTQFFSLFWLPAFFAVPLLTMRSFSHEKNHSTLNLILSTPTSKFAIVLSKFFSAYFLYLLIWAITLSFPIITDSVISNNVYDNPIIDIVGFLGGFTFISISSLLFIAYGIFASTLTRSQLIAAMLTFAMLFITCIGAQQLEYMAIQKSNTEIFLYEFINYISVFEHLEDFSLGILDTRPFIFYVSSTILILSITTNIVRYKS